MNREMLDMKIKNAIERKIISYMRNQTIKHADQIKKNPNKPYKTERQKLKRSNRYDRLKKMHYTQT